MMHLIKQLKYLKIQLEAIKVATNNFADENCIGRGGFGKVYKGELVHYKGQTVVAIKRLDPTFGQGNPEFWKEIIMLSLYKHENIVTLLGFCDESNEKILVYEYASMKSLDLYLNNDDLTWVRRLKICIGAARGLAYLHNPCGTQQRVLHRDIKSSNILLDENLNAKISDLGLSKFGPANQEYTFLVTNGVGTIGYCDPLYIETGLLTKESDVYSFGVVLFEVLCGRLCISNNNGIHRSLTALVREYYPQNKVNEIIYGSIKDGMNPKSLEMFASIAYRCLKRDLEERPLITDIVSTLEETLDYQVNYLWCLKRDLEGRPLMSDIVSTLEGALDYQLGLNSSDSTNNSNQSSSYEQGNTSQEQIGSSPHITQTSEVVCISGSVKGWDGFDPVRKKWMRFPDIPCDEYFDLSDTQCMAVGTELLVFGREIIEYAIWKYSLIQQNWVKCEGINQGRCSFGSGTLGSIAIVAGGCDLYGNSLRSAELYDSSTGRWEMLPNMHSPRKLCSGFFMDEKFYVIGGKEGYENDSFACGEEFDLKTKNWRPIKQMYPQYLYGNATAPPPVAVVSNELYALELSSNMVEKYDKKKNSWDILGRLPWEVKATDGWGVAFKACMDGFVVVAGQSGPKGDAIVLNYWNPQSGAVKDWNLDWKVLGVKPKERAFVFNCAVIRCRHDHQLNLLSF